MAEHPDCALVRRGYEAFMRGDMDALSQLMARDVVHHVPGSSPISGHHKGLDACIALYGRLAEETGGTMDMDLEGLFADGRGHVMSVTRLRAERKGRRLDSRGGIFFTIVGGKVTDLDECAEDIERDNEFWS
jgi:ketosteroid isomerase-like protein